MDTNISLNPPHLLYSISSFLLIFQGFSYGRQIYSLEKKMWHHPCIRFFQHYILMRQEKPLRKFFFFCFLRAVLNYMLSSWPVFLQRSIYAWEFSSSISFIFVAMLWVRKIIFERKQVGVGWKLCLVENFCFVGWLWWTTLWPRIISENVQMVARQRIAWYFVVS